MHATHPYLGGSYMKKAINEEELERLIIKQLSEKELKRIGNRSYVDAFRYPESRFDTKDLMPNGGDPVYRHVTDPFAKVIPPSSLIFQWKGLIYDKKWTGQVVGGLTDARTVIQSAGDAVKWRDAKIFLRRAAWLMNDSLIITPHYRNNLVIEGEGPGTILKLNDGVNKDVITQVGTDPCYNVLFRNFTIDGNKANNSEGGSGIHLRMEMCRLENLFVHDCLETGILDLVDDLGSLGIIYRDLWISGCGERGMSVGTDTTVLSCYVGECGERGGDPFFVWYASNVFLYGWSSKIVGCHIWGARAGTAGIFMNYSTDCIFADTVIEENLGPGMWIAGEGNYHQIIGNSFDNNSFGSPGTYDAILFDIEEGLTGNRNIISDNVFFIEAGGVAPHRYCVRESERCDYNVIQDNMMESGYTTGAVLIFGVHTIVKDNLGYNPVGVCATPFNNTAYTISNFGVAAGPTVADQDYSVLHTPCLIISTGGTGVAITIKDQAGTTIKTPGATCQEWLEPSWMINFGPFTVAPTVTVAAR